MPTLAEIAAKKAETRLKLVKAASTLFDKNGINATGVDAIISGAGVAKMTLYQHFASKDLLVVSVVEYQAQQLEVWIRSVGGRTAVPKAVRPLELFRDLESWAKAGTFFGAATVKAAAEFPSLGHPVHVALVDVRQKLTSAIADLLADCGFAEPQMKARRLKLVLDGAFVAAHALDGSTIVRDANTLAAMVIQR